LADLVHEFLLRLTLDLRNLLLRKGRRVGAQALPHLDTAREAREQGQTGRHPKATELATPLAPLEKVDHERAEFLVYEAAASFERALFMLHVHERLRGRGGRRVGSLDAMLVRSAFARDEQRRLKDAQQILHGLHLRLHRHHERAQVRVVDKGGKDTCRRLSRAHHRVRKRLAQG
jgi:hypothetical protein